MTVSDIPGKCFLDIFITYLLKWLVWAWIYVDHLIAFAWAIELLLSASGLQCSTYMDNSIYMPADVIKVEAVVEFNPCCAFGYLFTAEKLRPCAIIYRV